jgi:mannosyl-oligosaccharide alpha-1,2-mannosidase
MLRPSEVRKRKPHTTSSDEVNELPIAAEEAGQDRRKHRKTSHLYCLDWIARHFPKRVISRVAIAACFVLLIFLLIDEIMTSAALSAFPRYDNGHHASSSLISLENAKFAVVSMHTSGFTYFGRLGKFFRTNKQSYANAHRYAFVDDFAAEDSLVPLEPWQQERNNRHVYYKKARLLLYLMEKYRNLEWLLWLDEDCIVTHHNIRIQDRIQTFQRLHDKMDKSAASDLCLVRSKDDSMLSNAGVMFLRNSQTTRDLIRTSLLSNYEDSESIRKSTDQASALTETIKRKETYQNCQLLLEGEQPQQSPTLLQSQVRGPASWRWKPCHWILHFPYHQNRLELIKSLQSIGQQLKKFPAPIFPPLERPQLDTLSEERKARFEAVRASIRHAWNSYAYVALGGSSRGAGSSLQYKTSPSRPKLLTSHIPADDLSPMAFTGHDWLHYAATLHDSLDTLYLAGLNEEYDEAVAFVLRQDIQTTALQPTKVFEYSLRIVGGLLGAFSLTGDPRLLFRAKDAADALLQSPFRSSPTVLPRMYDVLFPPHNGSFLYKLYARIYQWGRDVFTSEHHFNSLAGVGSFALEFHFLSQVSGLNVYKETVNDIFDHVAKDAGDDGMVPGYWNVMTGLPMNNRSSLGSGSDSFYEYLLKVPLAGCPRNDESGALSCESDPTLQRMLSLYRKVKGSALRSNYIHMEKEGRQISGPVAYPVERGNNYHQLLCFLPGLVALEANAFELEGREGDSSDLALASQMIKGCQDMHDQTPTGLGPEQVPIGNPDVGRRPMGDHSYLLRPEYVESILIMYRITGDVRYQEMGWKVFANIERFCRTDTGYVGLQDVYDPNGGSRVDDMPSYFIAETLKYLLLLFGPDDFVSLDEFVFTTEAHPLRRKANGNSFALAASSDYAVPAPFPWVLWLAILLIFGLATLILFLVTRLKTRFLVRKDRGHKSL